MNKYEGFVGKVLDNRYKILELVGVGGMACVLKAQDLVMNRIVAIKILNDEYNGDEHAEARFIDESKAVAMLNNKNIVSVYDVAIYPDIKYIVMEYLDGITLREYLDNKGAIGWKEACIYTLQILRALEHAHSKGIVHRDIKPQNVILMRNGDIKVTDFGIAKLPNAEVQEKGEKAIGTVYYISPEQACGKETDYYSDIYSVGVMLYEAVTGTLPFIADSPMEVAMMQVNDEPVNPRDIDISIPVGVSQIILKAMEKSPAERFTSPHSMTKAIEWVLRNPDVIFSMSAGGADESPVGTGSVVSIDMIDTTEIEPYDDEEIAESLGHKRRERGEPEKAANRGKKPVRKKKKTSRSMFPIIFGVTFAFLIVAGVMGVILGLNAYRTITTVPEAPEAAYPEIKGEIYTSQLESNLRNGSYGAKFVIDSVTYDSRSDVENNIILATEPSGGHLSRPGSDGILHFTSITVNRSEKVVVPNLAGYSKNYASTMIKNLELKVEFVAQPDPDNEYMFDNQVIDTYPAAGSEVKVGDTVSVYIRTRDSASGKTGRMPDCIGMSVAEARKYAETYALYKVSVTEIETDEGDNTVIDQSIAAGTVSEAGSEVILTVAIPRVSVVMPDIVGYTYDEALELMPDFAPLARENGLRIYLTIGEEHYNEIITMGEEDTDIYTVASGMLEFGATRITSEDDDGSGIIVYQSRKPGILVTEETSCHLIIVLFTNESEASDIPGGDEPIEITETVNE